MLRCLILAGVVCLAGCISQNESVAPASTSEQASVTDAFPHKLTTAHLPNAVQIHQKVISGGQPEGEAGFAELARLGIKTVISVDGARPDVATAQSFGLRYVHLPHGYDGIPSERALELAKAVREFDGPIYIHCHHGKQRR